MKFEREIMKSELTGFILAGRQRKRMRSNQPFVRLQGKQLIEYALNTLKEVTPDVIPGIGGSVGGI